MWFCSIWVYNCSSYFTSRCFAYFCCDQFQSASCLSYVSRETSRLYSFMIFSTSMAFLIVQILWFTIWANYFVESKSIWYPVLGCCTNSADDTVPSRFFSALGLSIVVYCQYRLSFRGVSAEKIVVLCGLK